MSTLWAHDVAAEALERSIVAFDPNRPSRSTAPFRSFLLAVAHNTAFSHLRSEASSRARGETWQMGRVRLTLVEQIDDLVADADLVAHVVHAAHQKWNNLNPAIAQVCEMWLLGHDTASIAAALDIDPRTVRRHHVIIDEWLRSKFGD